MPVSPAKKKANAKWDAANMATLGCRLKKTDADRFREICAVRGVTVASVLSSFVKHTIAEYEAQKEEGQCK